jgi:hypothetical protein
VRTVEGHLQQVYAKLGMHRRSDLRHALDLPAPAARTPGRAGASAEDSTENR